jgi:hypothetical protein
LYSFPEFSAYKIGGAIMDEKDVFDIRDPKNEYEPCPKCNGTFGKGIASRNGRTFVRCTICNHEGPSIEEPIGKEWLTWPVPLHERDRIVFEAWNEAAKKARSSTPTS